jgi:hypothetical protein
MGVCIIAVIAGLFVMAGGITKLRQGRHLKAVGVRARGVVVDLRWSDGCAYPVVRFTCADGREVVMRSDIGRDPPAKRKGDVVDVLYDPADPEHARIAGWAHSGGFAGTLLILFGLGFLALGVYLAGPT